MVTDYFFVCSYFFQVCTMKIRKIKNYWDMEIIGNRRKKVFSQPYSNFKNTFFHILLTFLFPFQQLLSLWICEEKELVHEIAGLGELKSPWHKCQMAWLENHLNIINTYSQALETLDNYKGNIFLPLRNILRIRTLKTKSFSLYVTQGWQKGIFGTLEQSHGLLQQAILLPK